MRGFKGSFRLSYAGPTGSVGDVLQDDNQAAPGHGCHAQPEIRVDIPFYIIHETVDLGMFLFLLIVVVERILIS